MPDDSESSVPARAPALWAFGLGMVVSVLTALWLRSGREHAWEEEVRKRAQDRAEVIRGQIARSMEVLHAVGAFFDARGEVTRQEFRAFVERPLARQPELQALAWDARVPGPDRPAWEARAAVEGFPQFIAAALDATRRGSSWSSAGTRVPMSSRRSGVAVRCRPTRRTAGPARAPPCEPADQPA